MLGLKPKANFVVKKSEQTGPKKSIVKAARSSPLECQAQPIGMPVEEAPKCIGMQVEGMPVEEAPKCIGMQVEECKFRAEIMPFVLANRKKHRLQILE